MKSKRRLARDRADTQAPAAVRRSEAPEQEARADALRLQQKAGNAATAGLVSQHGKGPIEEGKPLAGRLGVQRLDFADVANAAAAAAAAVRPSQDVKVSPIRAAKDLGKGGYDWKVWFSIGAPAGADGWVIQEVKYTETGTKSDGGSLDESYHYWEAWQLKKGKKTTIYQDEGLDDNDDQYYTAAQPAGSKGSISCIGKARFFEGDLPADFKKNNPSTIAGILYSSTSPPPYWSGSMTDHNLVSTWDDSGSPTKTNIKTTP